ncbi:MAG: D-serine ammonia-lyase [Negativicutes bacterium]|nr:D-serine ammonia-lyase [Negativicutes bacterium]
MDSVEDLKKQYPLLDKIIATNEVFWVNPKYSPDIDGRSGSILGKTDIDEAENRLIRFAPYIAEAFPETRQEKGVIESPLVRIPGMQAELKKMYGHELSGFLYLKCDSQLPISGSIKARGGIYEVLKIAEDIAVRRGLLSVTDDYAKLDSEYFRRLFSEYSIIVGSTGNLGLSIGIIGAKLGFKVVVHMSSDAQQWKKDMLRSKGVKVVEHSSDYTRAVEAGRSEALQDANSHFVDDENSRNLFLGYAVAARRLKKQLDALNVPVDKDHPLFVYLPCGVGGGPGGVTFGLKSVFRENVHCFFAEPTHSPAMLVGLLTGLHDQISVQQLGIDNITDADGLAVGRPSGFVGKLLERDISGVYTVQDEELYSLLRALADSEKIYLEPSALAGFMGPVKLFAESSGLRYLKTNQLINKVVNTSHIVWATGGSMVPVEIMKGFYNRGK